MAIDEASVNSKTVPQLKGLLSAHNLPTSGLKADLIARVLANPQVLEEGGSSSQPATTTATAPTPAPAASTPATATAVPETTTEKPAATNVDEELERRKKRAERFGTTAAAEEKTVDGGDEKKSEREKRFGTAATANAAASPNKGIDKLDVALGEGKRGKKGKAAAGEGGVGTTAATTPTKTAAKPAPVNVDPARLAEEEEKKRKRAERFGGGDQPEKKAKTVA